MTQKIKISMCDGVKVVVPDSLNLITPYVLYEQEDWFEDEIKFLEQSADNYLLYKTWYS